MPMPGLVPGICVSSLGVDGRHVARPPVRTHGISAHDMKARVTVTLKTGILDPQGKAIEGALRSLGVDGVATVRQGKVFDIEIEGADRAKAEAAAQGGRRQAPRQYGDRELPGRGAGMTGGSRAMKAAVLVFPGINRERDMARTLQARSPAAHRRWSGTPRPRCRPAPTWS